MQDEGKTPQSSAQIQKQGIAAALEGAEHAQSALESAPRSRFRWPGRALKRALSRAMGFVLRPQSVVNRGVISAVRSAGRALSQLDRGLAEEREARTGLQQQLSRELAQEGEARAALQLLLSEVTDRHLPAMTEDLVTEFAELRSVIHAQGRQLDEAAGELVATTNEIEELRELLEATKQALREVKASAEQRLTTLEKRFEPLLSLDHFDFARRYRGDEEVIQRRLRRYAKLFGPVERVLDFGCGRGEFLLECSRLDIGAYGVDSDPDMVSHCRLKKMDVIEGDALEHLRGVPNRSLDGIFCAHVVEHLTPAEIVELIDLAADKLKRGGLITVETINPATLSAMRWFYLDPTHSQPVPHEMLRYFLEKARFEIKDIMFSSPVSDDERIAFTKPEMNFEDPSIGELVRLFNENGRRLNDILFGPQDYAIVAER